jgi:hypothetical protein
MVLVVNVKHVSSYHYVGRSLQYGKSKLGNPFVMKSEGDREFVVSEYRKWLWKELNSEGSGVRLEMMGLLDKLKSGEVVVLGCHCKPKGCHADVIKSALEWMLKEGW